MFPAFSDSRECKLLKVPGASARLLSFPFICSPPASNLHFVSLLQKLLEAHEEQNSDAFTEAVSLQESWIIFSNTEKAFLACCLALGG